MLKNIQKYASIISTLLLVVLFAALLFRPASSRAVSTVAITFSIGTAIVFTVHGNWKKRQSSKLTHAAFLRSTALDLFGLALTMTVAVWLGGLAGQYAAQRAGTGFPAVIASLLAALGVGFAAAWLVQKIWEMATTRPWAAGAG